MIATDLRLAPIDAAQRAASIGISEIPQNAKSTFFWACKVITCYAALRAAQLFPPLPLLPPLFSFSFPPPLPLPSPLRTFLSPKKWPLGYSLGHWGIHKGGSSPGHLGIHKGDGALHPLAAETGDSGGRGWKHASAPNPQGKWVFHVNIPTQATQNLQSIAAIPAINCKGPRHFARQVAGIPMPLWISQCRQGLDLRWPRFWKEGGWLGLAPVPYGVGPVFWGICILLLPICLKRHCGRVPAALRLSSGLRPHLVPTETPTKNSENRHKHSSPRGLQM